MIEPAGKLDTGPLEGNTVQIFDPKGKQRDESDS